MIFNHSKVLKSCSLSTQSLASCVNYFVWNCLPCFSNTKIGSVTSFSILFNFQGPVSASADRLTTWLFYHRSDFLSSSFFRSFWTFWTWMFQNLSNLFGISQRLLVLFKGFSLRLWKSFFCLSTWRSSIIPHTRTFVNTFLLLFSSFFAFIWNVLIEMSPRAFFQWNALRRGSIFSRKKTAHAMHRRSFAYITL